jgi:D-3-phosphoglycerate dehydrogenase / 2-oxoglutarate reductase
MKPIVTIFESIHPCGINILKEFASVKFALGVSRYEQLKLSSKSSVIVIKSIVKTDEELLVNSPNLQIVARAGTGTDNINLEEAKRLGVKVLTVPSANAISAAEFTMMQVLFLCRRLSEVISFVQKGDYRRQLLEGRELQKMVVGLVGLGDVGMAVMERLTAFGCKIIGWDPTPKNVNKFISLGGTLASSFDEMLPNIDILSFHARLTKDNYHMLSKLQFNLMKDGLLLINNARAELINDTDLLAAINTGKVAAAFLDVIEPEPPFDLKPERHAYNHKLLNNKNIMITPHIGASTIDAQERISLDLAMQIKGNLIY